MQRISPRPRRFDFDVITDPVEPGPAPRPPQDIPSVPATVAPVRGAPVDATKLAE